MIRRASNERGKAHVHPRHRVKIHGTKMDQPGFGAACPRGARHSARHRNRHRAPVAVADGRAADHRAGQHGLGVFTNLGAYDFPTLGGRERVAAQILTDIGFLGTGVIVKEGLRPFGR